MELNLNYTLIHELEELIGKTILRHGYDPKTKIWCLPVPEILEAMTTIMAELAGSSDEELSVPELRQLGSVIADGFVTQAVQASGTFDKWVKEEQKRLGAN